METELKGRPVRLGIWFAAIYIVIVAGVYVMTSTSKPDEFGYIWIPFLMLAMPWYSFIARFFTPNWLMPAIPGFVLNAGILFLAGTLLGKRRWSPVGIWLAGIYSVILIAALFIPVVAVKPDSVDLRWLTFLTLAKPWNSFNPYLLLPGLILNAALLYLIGMVIEKLWRPLAKRSA
jgi:hypothetical protein